MQVLVVASYSLAHFAVDFCCAFSMLRLPVPTESLPLCLLLYNFCAFALQMPLGLLADKLNKNAIVAAAGCLVVAAASGLGFVPMLAAATAGVGNSLFHVGGGIDVMNIGGKKSGPLGVFVSPGALGLYLGALLGVAGAETRFPVWGVALAAAALLLAAKHFFKNAYLPNAPLSLTPLEKGKTRIVLLLFFCVVCLRSFIGLVMQFPWKTPGVWATILVLAVVLGKTAGGFLSDRFGAKKTAVISLGGAAILFLLSSFPMAGLPAVLLFNMTMPITLWALSRTFPGAKGFSFGLLTFALFLGYLPVFFNFIPAGSVPLLYAAGAALSLPMLYFGLRAAKL